MHFDMPSANVVSVLRMYESLFPMPPAYRFAVKGLIFISAGVGWAACAVSKACQVEECRGYYDCLSDFTAC
jgi:hypothetical protein